MDNYIIVDIDAVMGYIIQPLNRSPMKYTEAIQNKVLRCSRVPDEYVFKGIFIKGLP